MTDPYTAAKELRRGIHNPWLARDLDLIMADNSAEWKHEFILTVGAYVEARNHGRLPFRCIDCRGEVHFKPNIVGYKCTTCSKLYFSNRDPVPRRNHA